ncbi:MAG: beta-N-acetylglucosaminidase domain-containing protein [Bacteroidaceae bacterium]|nr:beta-N-acetylglucosaminidase domain-containing protein [Bacteroidaceae bacterium]
MKKKLLVMILMLLPFMVQGQQNVTVSPLPQKATWGGKAFNKAEKFYLVGADRADSDAVELLAAKLDILGVNDKADAKKFPRAKAIILGEEGDKAVKKYKKQIPDRAEGYYLQITPDQIVIAGKDEAGTFYGVQSLLQIMSRPEVMQCEITDWPSVSCRGVIEGFYGNPWSHKDRLRQFDFYGQHKMNIYVYGPKDDPYHRAKWREPYPEKEAALLRELVEAAHRNKVQFVWAIHPGGDIKWNKTDSVAVVDKLEKMYALGIRTFAVFFDDIWGEGAKGDKQAGLLNYVTDEFVRKHTDVEPLIMCPTQYNKAWSGGDYLPTLGTKMYPEVRIMWTGNSVVDMIEKNDMEWINGQIRRKAFIWLNYPVNDYCQSRLLMGKTYGNGKDIYDMVSGFCSNPMEYAEASKVSLYSIADYTWNMPAYDAESSWKRSLRALMPTSPLAFAAFCQNNIDLGKTGHGLRREGESQLFAEKKVKPAFYFTTMTTAADALLADSVNQPEMLAEIGPWVESMRLLGQRGLQVLQMEHYLNQADSVAFIGAYRRLQAIEQAQKAIVSRNFEGSIVKAKPVVSGDVVTPWINTKANELVKAYRKQYAYGREFFPQQVIEDGQYFIKAGGKFLTDVQAATDRTGDHPVFVADRDNINPQRQQWFIELVPSTGRYKITNVQDGRYVNERGTFWKDKNLNPFEAEWHTFVIAKTQDGKFTVQCGGNAGKGYWNVKEDRIENQKEPAAFEIVPANK